MISTLFSRTRHARPPASPARVLLARCRVAAAVVLGIAGLVLFGIGLGLSDLLPLPKTAVAESAPADMRGLPPSVLPDELGRRLQSSVDSAAVSLGGVLGGDSTGASGPQQASDEGARRNSLARAISALTFGLEGEVYFSAWQGTRVVHSPLAPDAVGMDFAAALDQRGSAFVLRMEDAALNGGGFLQVRLPRQLAPQIQQTPQTSYTAPVDQIVYVRAIPQSDWHIAAFMPVSPGSLSGEGRDLEGDLRKGLFVSGFSLAGLAALLLTPGRGRGREEEPGTGETSRESACAGSGGSAPVLRPETSDAGRDSGDSAVPFQV